MTATPRMTIEADSSADLLCRMLGLFAQRDLAAPGMRVDITGRQMIVTLDLAGIDDGVAALLAEKAARFIGVAAITVDGVPLAYVAPGMLLSA